MLWELLFAGKHTKKTRGTMAFEVQLLYTVALSLAFVEANIVQNCSANACDLKTCVNTTQRCDQSCYTSNCQMACTSPQGCFMNCANGGCSSLSCDVPYTSGVYTSCEQSCLGNCMDMKCKANSCHLTCLGDNCRITCRGTGATSGCYPRCRGRGCHIDVYSQHAEPWCIKGSCIVRMSKISNGVLSCPGGNCTFTCANGTQCAFNGACPNCTGPIFVDDPFGTNASSALKKSILLFIVLLADIFILFP